MRGNKPKVSVIIPAYNGEDFLGEATESINKQNYQPLEIIIVDDGSTDKTAEIAKGLNGNVKYLYQAHSGGPATGRNRGIREAQGELIAFLDQDDLFSEDKLALQVSKMNEQPKLDIVLGRTQMLRLREVKNDKYEFEKYSQPWVTLMLSSALFRKSVFGKVGLFDEGLNYYGNDYDWFMRARELGVLLLIQKETTLFWRIHNNNQTHDKSIVDHSQGRDHATMEILKKSLDRRRQQGQGKIEAVPQFSTFDELKKKIVNNREHEDKS